MKHNSLIVGGVAFGLLLISLSLVLWSLSCRKATESPSPPKQAAATPAPDLANQEKAQPAPKKDSVGLSTALQTLSPEFEKQPTPVWGVEIAPIAPGTYKYWFYLDGKQICDPSNPATVSGQTASLLVWPPRESSGAASSTSPSATASRTPSPRVVAADRAVFLYEGPIERSLLFIAPFRGEWWGTDEFQPLNAAARANLQAVRANPSLGIVYGMVLDSMKRPIPRALVRVSDRNREQNQGLGLPYLQTVACDNAGRFRLDRLPKTFSDVRARALGYGESNPTMIFITAADNAMPLEIVLSATSLVGGTVANEAGAKIKDATITARASTYSERYRLDAKTTTDESGRFAFHTLGAGTYDFLAEAEGYAPAVQTRVRLAGAASNLSPVIVDFTLTQGIAVKGRVVQRPKKSGGEETGVEGANVVFTGTIADSKGRTSLLNKPAARIRSGKGGWFTIERLSPLTVYECEAHRGAQASDKVALALRKDHTPTSVVLRLPVGGQAAARVVDEEKKPVVGAKAQLRWISRTDFDTRTIAPEDAVEAMTDATGRFVLDGVESGARCSVQIKAEGFADGSLTLSGGSLIEPEVVLKRPAAIAGRVVEEDTSRPLGNARVNLGGLFGASYDSQETVTAADGSFRFSNVSFGDHTLTGRAVTNGKTYVIQPQSVSVRDGKATDSQGRPANEIVLHAATGASVQGLVLDADSREPIAGARVKAKLTLGSGAFPRPGQEASSDYVQTNAKGSFTLTELMHGKITMDAWKDGYWSDAPVTVEVQAGETKEGVEVLLSRGRSVSGTVLDDTGKPAPDVPLQLIGVRAFPDNKERSDETGRFVFSGIRNQSARFAEACRVRAVPDGINPLCGESDMFRLTEETPHVEVTVRLTAGGSVSGKVTDKRNEPIALANVWASRSSGEDDESGLYVSATSDLSGRYLIAGLAAGEFQVRAQLRDRYNPSKEQWVKIEAGKTVENIDFTLEEKEEVPAIKGTLVDLRGKPLPRYQVSARPSVPTSGLPPGHTETGHDGTFLLAGLAKGPYILDFNDAAFCQVRDFDPSEEKSADSPEGKIFIVPIGATVKGRLVFKGSGKSLAQADLSLSQIIRKPPEPKKGEVCLLHWSSPPIKVAENDDGRFQIESAPVGALDLTIQSKSAVARRIEKIGVGKDLLVDLGDIELTPAHTIKMKPVDGRTRQPYRATMPGQFGPDVQGLLVSGGFASGNRADIGYQRFTNTDSEGYITIRSLPDDLTSLTLESPEYFPYQVLPVHLDSSGETDLGTILLDPGLTATGRFVDAATGKPCGNLGFQRISGTAASGKPAEHIEMNRDARWQYVDQNGRFTIRRIPGDIVRITVSFAGYANQTIDPVKLAPTGITNLGDVAISRGQTVRGKLMGPKGEAAAGARVFIAPEGAETMWQFAQTDAQGEFMVQGVLTGTAVLRAEASKGEGKNRWIEGDEYREVTEVRMEKYRFTVRAEGETLIEVRFPTAMPWRRR